MDSLGTTSMSLTGNESRENDWLVVSTPLKNNNGKDYPIYYGKRNMFETTSQMKVYNVCMKKQSAAVLWLVFRPRVHSSMPLSSMCPVPVSEMSHPSRHICRQGLSCKMHCKSSNSKPGNDAYIKNNHLLRDFSPCP